MGTAPGSRGVSQAPRRLDPDRAAAARAKPPPGGEPPPTVDVRRYRWMIGGFGLVLVVVISVSFLATHRIGTAGVPAGNGPTLCLGYWDDPIANEQLFTADGWMRMGDLATIDGNGYLTVVGRTSDVLTQTAQISSAF